jgi:hypothetical protein
MTNTLHRRGPRARLQHDYIIFACPHGGADREQAAAKMKEFLRICLGHNPVRTKREEGRTSALFAELPALQRVIEELVRADLGISIVVSGLMEEVQQCCRLADIERHSAEHSLGIWGAMDRLPERSILEINSLCGHGLVSFNFIHKMIEYVKLNRLTAKEAASMMADSCDCGAFNPLQAEILLERARRGNDDED